MLKYIIHISFFISVLLSSCKTDKISEGFVVTSTAYELNDAKIESVSAYIDPSGSMKGYFSDADPRFFKSVIDASYDHLYWADSKFTEINGNPTKELLAKNFKGQDTNFDVMFSQVINHAKLENNNQLALLYTDGIMGASKKETDKDPNVILKSRDYYKKTIKDSLKRHRNLAAAVFMLNGLYSGNYDNYKNEKISNVDIKNRPFYVVALGKPDVVRSFLKSNKLNAKIQEGFGIYNNQKESVKGYYFSAVTPKDWKNGKLASNKIEFYLTLPDYISNLGNDYIIKNCKLELDEKDVTDKLLSTISINGSNLKLGGWMVNDISKPILTPGKHNLEFRVVKSRNDEWSKYSSDDDTSILTNVSEQNKTFSLKYFVEGIEEAFEENEIELFSSSIEFVK